MILGDDDAVMASSLSGQGVVDPFRTAVFPS